MGHTEQLKLAYAQSESRRKKVAERRRFLDDLDEQLALARQRWELTLGGRDAHKVLAEEITDDEEHPVALTTVYDWFSRRNGRRVPDAVISFFYETDVAFAAWWNERHGYTVPEKLVRLPWEQERALYRRALQEFGAAGEVKLRAITNARPEVTP